MDGLSGFDDVAAARMKGLTQAMAEAVAAVEAYVDAATGAARASLSLPNGKPDRAALDSADPVLRQITALLEGRGASIVID